MSMSVHAAWAAGSEVRELERRHNADAAGSRPVPLQSPLIFIMCRAMRDRSAPHMAAHVAEK